LKNLLPVVALLLAWPTVGFSQAGEVIPRFALFGGFTRVFDQADPNSFPAGSFHFDGGEVSAEGKVSRWVGIVGGYGLQWNKQEDLQGLALVGPQFSPHAIHHGLIPFAHVLVGFAHGITDGTNGNGSSGVTIVSAAAVGGGLDIKMGRGFWFRAIQADWLHADLSPDHHTTARISAGIVLRH